jgi:hypothetical protein
MASVLRKVIVAILDESIISVAKNKGQGAHRQKVEDAQAIDGGQKEAIN